MFENVKREIGNYFVDERTKTRSRLYFLIIDFNRRIVRQTERTEKAELRFIGYELLPSGSVRRVMSVSSEDLKRNYRKVPKSKLPWTR